MKRSTVAAVSLLLALAAASAVRAQSGGTFDLSWFTTDSGGSTVLSGGAFELGGTAGQADAAELTGGSFALQGGFWLCLTADVAAASITASGSDVVLNWTAGEPTANIYRGEDDPYFTPGAVYAGGVSNGWTDTGAAGSPAHNYTYIIRPQGACGESPGSRRLGEFDVTLTPGS